MTLPQKSHLPLVVFGASGMLASQLVFLAEVDEWPSQIILHGSTMSRLQGVAEEMLDAGLTIPLVLVTDFEEAISYGGNVLYATSVQSRAQTREAMLLQNAPTASRVGKLMSKYKSLIKRVVCVSNPSDLIGLTLLVNSGLPASAVMSLSALDTIRYRKHLSRYLDIPVEQIRNAWTLGSHDQSMAVMRDIVEINGTPLVDVLQQKNIAFEQIAKDVVFGGAQIIKLRGHTAYQSPAWLCYQMLRATDARAFTLPTARYINTPQCPHSYLSLPAVVGSGGCQHWSVRLSEWDRAAFNRSYSSVKGQMETLIKEGILPPITKWPEELREPQQELIY